MNGNMADGWGDLRWKILGKMDGENGWNMEWIEVLKHTLW